MLSQILRRFAVCLALPLVSCAKTAPDSTPSTVLPPPGRPEGAASADAPTGENVIEVFVGSASKPATEELVVAFQEKTGIRVIAHYGGSGQMLSQMKVTGRGDVYFPGSSDYMEKAKQESLVDPATEEMVVFLVPAINVPKGNPKKITGLADLAKPGVRVGIARPDAVCVGLYAVETLERAKLSDQVRPNIVTQTESCEKTAQLVALGNVDAVLGWEVFEHWQPDKIETIPLKPEEVSRIGYIPIAVVKNAPHRALAEQFVKYVISGEGKAFFRKWHYLVTEEDARKFARPDAPVGGEWPLPESWQ